MRGSAVARPGAPCHETIRADEDREGYISTKANITARYPFKEAGIVKSDVYRILEESGLGVPEYYKWRTRSGCYFCFFQQKIEWVRLKEKYPEKFEEAKRYEYASKSGNAFYWNGEESLEELEKPERVEEIKRKWVESRVHLKNNSANLVHILGGLDVEEEENEACLICHL